MPVGVVKTGGGQAGNAPPGFIGIFTYRPGNRFAGPRGWVMALRAMALITPAPSGAAATAKPAAGQAKRPNVKAAQALAKQMQDENGEGQNANGKNPGERDRFGPIERISSTWS